MREIVETAKAAPQTKFVAHQLSPINGNSYETTAEWDHLIVLNGAPVLDVHDSKFSSG